MLSLQEYTKDQAERAIIEENMPNVENVKKLSNYFSIFADCTRLRILILLSIRQMQVGDIADYLGINQTTTSHQLKILKFNNVVDYVREGKNITYFLKDGKEYTIPTKQLMSQARKANINTTK